ncbi:hypothetical protein IW261DRAFT_1422862 [Armillaria novae-zelandiae]|uniref:Uncharacterized protein n=1 Tax=Armillaria novae-zelandiae TaxID=153914 RepID=A0AA39U582_9AGAR|nr:hypothetical protein IW261DRAFT_1422862 [Armillaria novae-zelandiae]
MKNLGQFGISVMKLQVVIDIVCIAPRERDEASTAGANDDGGEKETTCNHLLNRSISPYATVLYLAHQSAAVLYTLSLCKAAGLGLAWGLEILKPSPEPSQAIITAQAGLGIAPTLLIGCVAAGHARPDDSWWGSIASSLHFGAGPRGQTQTSLQQDYMASAILDDDLEALQEQDNEYSHHIPAESREVVDKSVGSQKNVPDDDPHITASVSII